MYLHFSNFFLVFMIVGLVKEAVVIAEDFRLLIPPFFLSPDNNMKTMTVKNMETSLATSNYSTLMFKHLRQPLQSELIISLAFRRIAELMMLIFLCEIAIPSKVITGLFINGKGRQDTTIVTDDCNHWDEFSFCIMCYMRVLMPSMA